MFKRPLVRVGMWLALAALFAWIYVESQRGPDYVGAALKHVPHFCNVVGVWRDTSLPEASKQFWTTYVLCDDSEGVRNVISVLDGQTQYASIKTLDERNSTEGQLMGGDVYRVNPDGSLTISDDAGEIATLTPAKH